MSNSKNTAKSTPSFPPIITTPDPRLRQKSLKANPSDPETKKIIDEMIASSLAWENEHEFEISAAMAAPQLGYNRRIIIVRENTDDKSNSTFIPLINPEVVRTEGRTIKDHEGCLSVPNIYGLVPRPYKARIKATTVDGQSVRLKVSGFLARTILHEIDHLDGILFIDHIKNDRKAFFILDEKGDLKPIDYDKYIKNNPDLWPQKD